MDCDNSYFMKNENEVQYSEKNDDYETEEQNLVAKYASFIDEIPDLNTLEKEAKRQINNPKSTEENLNQIYYENINIRLEKQREKRFQKQWEKHQKELQRQQEKHQKELQKQLIKQQKELQKQKEKLHKQEDKNFLSNPINKLKQLLPSKNFLTQNEKNKDEPECVLNEDDEYFKLQLELAQAISEADTKQLVQTKYDNKIANNEVMEDESKIK